MNFTAYPLSELMNNCKGVFEADSRGKLLISWHPQGFEKAAPSRKVVSVFLPWKVSWCQKNGPLLGPVVGWNNVTASCVQGFYRHTFNSDGEWQTLLRVCFQPFPGFCFSRGNFLPEFRVGERLAGSYLSLRTTKGGLLPSVPDKFLWDSLSWKPGGSQCMMWQSFWKQIWGREVWLMDNFMSLVILAPSHDFFPKEKKNAEAVSRSWDSVRNILGQSKVLPDSGSPPCGLLPGLVYIPSSVYLVLFFFFP